MAKNKTNAFERDLLLLLFNNTALSGIGSGLPAATTAGSFYLAFFVGDPTEDGTTASLECTNNTNATTGYPNYARQAIARSGAGFTVQALQTGGSHPNTSTDTDAGTTVKNAALVAFPQCGAGGSTLTVTHIGICKSATIGTQDIIIAGPLTTNLTIASGVTPQFAAEAIVFTEY